MPPEIAIGLFLLAGLPAALALEPLPRAFPTGVLVSLTGAYLALVLHLAIDLPILTAWALAMGAATLLAVAGPWRWRLRVHVSARWTSTDRLLLLAFALLALLLAGFPEAADWDARNIWFSHAHWLGFPATTYLQAQLDPSLLLSHPDYPALGSAAVAIVWRLAGGGEDLDVAVRLVTLLNLSIVLLATRWLLRLAGAEQDRRAASIGLLAFLALIAIHPGQGRNNGYMDVLQGASVLSAAAALLTSAVRPRTREGLVALTLATLVAVNVKQEGLPFLLCVILAAVAILRSRSVVGPALLAAAVALGSSTLYGTVLTQLGRAPMTDAGGISSRITELLAPGSPAWAAIARMFDGYLVPYSALFLWFVGCAWLALALRPRRDTAFLAVSALAVAAVLVVGVIVLTYALGNSRADLDGWLYASYYRISCTVTALAIGGVVVALLAPRTPSAEATA